MLPVARPHPSSGKYRSYQFLPQYFRRIVKWRQMDIEFTFWQMLNLCVNPRLVYKQTSYRKQTKNQWARDDPAFIVITCILVAIAAAAYCVAFEESILRSILIIISAVVMDFLLVGMVIATAFWALANSYLIRKDPSTHLVHAVDQRVEWLYAYDIHCNAYFPLFIALYVVQYFLCPLLLLKGKVSAILSSVLYILAVIYYHYLTFLGYNYLPFLERTEVFLLPIWGYVVLLPISIVFPVNLSQIVIGIYFGKSV